MQVGQSPSSVEACASGTEAGLSLGSDRREAYRVRPSFGERVPVKYRVASKGVEAWLCDLSITGVRITCSPSEVGHLVQNERVYMRIALPDGEPPLCIHGWIVSVHAKNFSAQFGVRFEYPDRRTLAPSENRLLRYVMQRQRQLLTARRSRH